MIALIVLILMLVGVVSVAGYSVLSAQQSASQLMKAVEENRRLDQWQVLLERHAVAAGADGALVLPIGEDLTDNSTSYHALPPWISTDRFNAWGRPLRYCPYAPLAVSGTSVAIPLGDGVNSYNVSTTTVNGESYVTGSDSPPVAGVLGVILSPLPNAAVVTCADLSLVGGVYQVPGRAALVRVITVDSLATHVEETPVIVSLTGDNAAEHTTIINEMLQWNVRQPERLIIRLADAATPYEWPDLDFDSSEPGQTRVIKIIGESRAGTVIDGTDEVFRTLSFSGVDLFIENVSFTDRVALEFERGRLETANVTMGQAALSSASWHLTGSTGINGASSSDTDNSTALSLASVAVEQGSESFTVDGESGTQLLIDHRGGHWNAKTGASLALTSPGTPTGIRLTSGAAWFLSEMSFSADDDAFNTGKYTALFDVAAGSQARFFQVDVDLTVELATVFATAGAITLDGGTTIDFTRGADAGMVLVRDASLTLDGSARIGTSAGSTSQPVLGIQALGGRFVGGAAADIHATGDCWQGTLFTSVASATSGSSAPIDSQYAIVNQSNWTCY